MKKARNGIVCDRWRLFVLLLLRGIEKKKTWTIDVIADKIIHILSPQFKKNRIFAVQSIKNAHKYEIII